MERATRELSHENFDIRIPVHSNDQIGRLEQAVNRMASDLKEKQKIKTVFGHYVSPLLRDMILEGTVNTDGEKIEAVVLFSHIRAFTRMSDNFPPESIVRLLNAHFSRAVGVVSQNNGFVDKFIGDAIMAVFDSSLCAGMHRYCALVAARQILESVQETNAEISYLGLPPFSIGVGLASGLVIRGNIESESRKELQSLDKR